MKRFITKLRTYLIASYIVLLCLIFAPFVFIISPLHFVIHGFDNIMHFIIRYWGKLGLIFHPVKIIGSENLLKNQAVIVISNHQSNFDIPLFNGYLKIQFRWLAKAELFRIPVFGWVMKMIGYIPVDRGNREKAKRSIDKAAQKIINGTSVVIFPEGTWGKPDGTMIKFKKGSYHLAQKSHVPIIPVTIVGSNKINPNDNDLKINFGKIKMIIDKPIYYNEYQNLSAEQFLDNIKGIIQKNLDKYN